MITVDRVWHFYGTTFVPAAYAGGGPFTLVQVEIDLLITKYDVMFHHVHEGLVLGLDVKGKRFAQR